MDIGNRIRYFRKLYNKTLKEISLDTGLSISFISNIEKGIKKCSLENLEAICSAIGVSLSEFFAEDMPAEINELLSISKSLDNEKLKILLKIAKALKE
jgi:transcriptional regulator with XRE-family HTH domain